MDINEKAEKYADIKANKAMTKAIAQAYRDGYRDGYNARGINTPAGISEDNNTKYIDLGLPSRTLWSLDYEKNGDSILYLPYGRAARLKIPTAQQWKELEKYCKWAYGTDEDSRFSWAKCVGPNGNIIQFDRTGKIDVDALSNMWEAFFWIEKQTGLMVINNVHIYSDDKTYMREDYTFTGYHLPVRLVR